MHRLWMNGIAMTFKVLSELEALTASFDSAFERSLVLLVMPTVQATSVEGT